MLILRCGVMALWVGCLVVCGESAVQKKEVESPPKADAEQLRLAVAKNVMQLIKRTGPSEQTELAAQVYFEKIRWNAELATFQAGRTREIHDHAHGMVKDSMPGIMKNFMPKYMQAKIMAERKAKKAGGPPSAAEIEKIRANVKEKMEPAMQEEMKKKVMPALEKLAAERMAELLKDEKILTRALAERIMDGKSLSDAAIANFKGELDKAGYPASLIRGADPVLNSRAKKLIESIDIAAVAKKAGL